MTTSNEREASTDDAADAEDASELEIVRQKLAAAEAELQKYRDTEATESKRRTFVAETAWRYVIGSADLDDAARRIIGQVRRGRPPSSKDLGRASDAVLRRVVRIGALGVLLALVPTTLTICQLRILSTQTEVMQHQSEVMDQQRAMMSEQNALMEASADRIAADAEQRARIEERDAFLDSYRRAQLAWVSTLQLEGCLSRNGGLENGFPFRRDLLTSECDNVLSHAEAETSPSSYSLNLVDRVPRYSRLIANAHLGAIGARAQLRAAKTPEEVSAVRELARGMKKELDRLLAALTAAGGDTLQRAAGADSATPMTPSTERE